MSVPSSPSPSPASGSPSGPVSEPVSRPVSGSVAGSPSGPMSGSPSGSAGGSPSGPMSGSPSGSSPGSSPGSSSPFVRAAETLEGVTALDPVVSAVRPLADALVAHPLRRDLLRGAWLGHAVHPLLTDAPIGFWTSAVVLDLAGGREARGPAQRLVGLGLLTALPTALTGWAEWTGTGPREQRVGVVHAVSNVVAVGLFTASWRARRADRHVAGVALGLAASSALGVGGFLGGHLVSARKVSSRHPRFEG